MDIPAKKIQININSGSNIRYVLSELKERNFDFDLKCG